MAASEVEKRLKEIWREWQLTPGEDASMANQVKAAETLRASMIEYPDDVAFWLRMAQVALANPDTPGVHSRSCVTDLVASVEEDWKGAGLGDGRQSMALLLAILLAAWPGREEADGDGARAALILGLGARLDERTPSRRRVLDRWLSDLRLVGTKGLVDADLLSHPVARTLWPDQALTVAQKHAAQSPAAIGHIIAILQYLKQDGDRQDRQMTMLLEALQEAGGHAGQAANSQELLWWGQARFCHQRQIPYRRIQDPRERAWRATLEAAERASTLNPAPAASYLAQVLEGLGVDLDARKTLASWLDEYRPTLQSVDIEVPSNTAAFVKEDAMGFPVTAVRLGLDPVEAGARLDVELDMADFTSLMFREAVLCHLLDLPS